jgi:hypothetical protein
MRCRLLSTCLIKNWYKKDARYRIQDILSWILNLVSWILGPGILSTSPLIINKLSRSIIVDKMAVLSDIFVVNLRILTKVN